MERAVGCQPEKVGIRVGADKTGESKRGGVDPKPSSTREGDGSEITIFRLWRPYRTGLSGDSELSESRATGATTLPIAQDCDRPIDEVRGLPTMQSVKRWQRNTVQKEEERVTVKPLTKTPHRQCHQEGIRGERQSGVALPF